MRKTQDMTTLEERVDKLIRSKCRTSKYRKTAIVIGSLLVIGMVVSAGVISFVMHGNLSFDVKGKERWLSINENPIPYTQNLNMEIDAGDSGIISYQINNTWTHPITIYTSISGFTNLTVDLETIGELVLNPGSTWCNFSYSSDPWSYDDSGAGTSGNVFFNTTG